MAKKVYIIDNLDCANCAAKIEEKLNACPGVEEATITFSTRQLRLTAQDPDALIPRLQEIARTVESDAAIYPRDHAPQKEHHPEHHHEEGCCCGHDHKDDGSCGCGHDHDHDHHHDHDHEHDHHHDQ